MTGGLIRSVRARDRHPGPDGGRAGHRRSHRSYVALLALGACSTVPAPVKARDLTPAERDSLSQVLEPLLIAAGLRRGSVDGCAALYSLLEAESVGVAVTPHAPCRAKVVLTEGAWLGSIA